MIELFFYFNLYVQFVAFFHGSGSDPNFFADPDPGKKSDPDPDKRTRILNPVKEANTETFFTQKL